MKEHERAREIGERLGEMDDSGISFGEPMVRLDDHSKVLKAMQGLAEALIRIRDYPVYCEPVGGAYAMQDLARAALEAARPFLESK